MKRRAHFPDGALAADWGKRRGFTLLEMCMVLVVIALLLGMMTPAIESAFTEQAVRGDAHQLAMMVKTAMDQSSEEHRAYELDLTPTSMALHPVDEAAAPVDATPATNAPAAAGEDTPGSNDVVVTTPLDAANRLLVPDPVKANSWVPIPPTSWVFQPGDLCPATRVRLERGTSWLEMSFGALTGNVEDEKTYFP